jgi:hypothetical protein
MTPENCSYRTSTALTPNTRALARDDDDDDCKSNMA